MKNEIEEFLNESNAIEGIYEEDSLQQALYAWEFLISCKKLTIGVILKTHKILMLHQNLKPDERGYFRKVPVWISGREGINSIRISDEIKHWLMNVSDLLRSKETSIYKERIIKIQHIEYERIHPFIDGNGRTGRMFMNWQRIKAGLPILIIHTGKEQQDYYQWFK